MAAYPRHLILAGTLISVMMIGAVSLQGCQTKPSVRPLGATALPSNAASSFADGSYAEVKGDYARLSDDIPRAVKKSHWGLLSINAPKIAVETREPIHAEALAPDGRAVEILAWGLRQGVIAVAVRGGRFGSRELESLFITRLQRVLAGKPKPKRGGSFTIPE